MTETINRGSPTAPRVTHTNLGVKDLGYLFTYSATAFSNIFSRYTIGVFNPAESPPTPRTGRQNKLRANKSVVICSNYLQLLQEGSNYYFRGTIKQ